LVIVGKEIKRLPKKKNLELFNNKETNTKTNSKALKPI